MSRACIFTASGKELELTVRSVPEPVSGQVLVRVEACAVCRTDLHVVDGDLPDPKLPLVPGHEVIGIVEQVATNVTILAKGDRVGISWLASACGECTFCRDEKENLCDSARFTGYTVDGGFAEHIIADARFCFKLSSDTNPEQTAPFLCAGLIGWRSLQAAGAADSLGIYGFGAAAHIIAQVAIQQGKSVYAFTSPGDLVKQSFARELGCVWAGGSNEQQPRLLDAAIIFAPVGNLVPMALQAVRKGGTVVCGGIHMSDIPSFPYSLLWGERRLVSVANLTRVDGEEFFRFCASHKIQTSVTTYPLESTNAALNDLRNGRIRGAAVISMRQTTN